MRIGLIRLVVESSGRFAMFLQLKLELRLVA
jgi:hypothetical protein